MDLSVFLENLVCLNQPKILCEVGGLRYEIQTKELPDFF